MKTCRLNQDVPDIPIPRKRPFPWRSCWKIFFFGAGVTTAILFTQMERGRTAEYAAMEKERDAAKKSAADSKAQLELTLKNGDCGILLFNIDPDIGPSQLRLMQTPARRS